MEAFVPPNRGLRCGHDRLVRITKPEKVEHKDSSNTKENQQSKNATIAPKPKETIKADLSRAAKINPNSLLLHSRLTNSHFVEYCMPCLDRGTIWNIFQVKPVSLHFNLGRYYCPKHATKYKREDVEDYDTYKLVRLICEDAEEERVPGKHRCRQCEEMKQDDAYKACLDKCCPNFSCTECRNKAGTPDAILFHCEGCKANFCPGCYVPTDPCNFCHNVLCRKCEKIVATLPEHNDNAHGDTFYRCISCLQGFSCQICFPPSKKCSRCNRPICPKCVGSFEVYVCHKCNRPLACESCESDIRRKKICPRCGLATCGSCGDSSFACFRWFMHPCLGCGTYDQCAAC